MRRRRGCNLAARLALVGGYVADDRRHVLDKLQPGVFLGASAHQPSLAVHTVRPRSACTRVHRDLDACIGVPLGGRVSRRTALTVDEPQTPMGLDGRQPGCKIRDELGYEPGHIPYRHVRKPGPTESSDSQTSRSLASNWASPRTTRSEELGLVSLTEENLLPETSPSGASTVRIRRTRRRDAACPSSGGSHRPFSRLT